jgi:hypothetical protein
VARLLDGVKPIEHPGLHPPGESLKFLTSLHVAVLPGSTSRDRNVYPGRLPSGQGTAATRYAPRANRSFGLLAGAAGATNLLLLRSSARTPQPCRRATTFETRQTGVGMSRPVSLQSPPCQAGTKINLNDRIVTRRPAVVDHSHRSAPGGP